MNHKKNYKTKQKELILACLIENKSRLVTAETIVNYLKDRKEPVGQTTVYRNLDKLVKDGIVLRFNAPDGMYSCYQYIEKPAEEPNNYHLVCVECGQMQQINCDHIQEFSTHIQEKHDFRIDSFKTVLFGRCRNCNAK